MNTEQLIDLENFLVNLGIKEDEFKELITKSIKKAAEERHVEVCGIDVSFKPKLEVRISRKLESGKIGSKLLSRLEQGFSSAVYRHLISAIKKIKIETGSKSLGHMIGKNLVVSITGNLSDTVYGTYGNYSCVLPRRKQIKGEKLIPSKQILVCVEDISLLGNSISLVVSRVSDKVIINTIEELIKSNDYNLRISKIVRSPGYFCKVLIGGGDSDYDSAKSKFEVLSRYIHEEFFGESLAFYKEYSTFEDQCTELFKETTVISIENRDDGKVLVHIPERDVKRIIGRNGTNIGAICSLLDSRNITVVGERYMHRK